MPCTYYTPEEEARLAVQAANSAASELRETNANQRQYINTLTRLLCEATETLSTAIEIIENEFGSDQGVTMSDELETWKLQHDELDRQQGRK